MLQIQMDCFVILSRDLQVRSVCFRMTLSDIFEDRIFPLVTCDAAVCPLSFTPGVYL